MRALSICTAASIAFAFLAVDNAIAVTSPGRAYQFGFRNGNLVRNWSFENIGDNWYDEASVTARYLAKKDAMVAVSGSYVAKFSGSNSSGSAVKKLTSEFMPIEAGTAYTLSLYVKTSSTLAGTRPVVVFYDKWAGTAMSGPFTGGNYPTNVDWTLVSYSFTPPVGANFAQIVLAEMATGQNGTAHFDDIVLENGSAATARDSIAEVVTLFNDFGQTLQTHTKIAGGGYNLARKHLVEGTSFDYQMRPTNNYMPYVRYGIPGMDEAYAANAKTYNSGTNGKETLGDFPFTSTQYSDVLAKPVDRTLMAGTAWNAADLSKSISSGSYFTASLVAPSNIEYETTDAAERPYLYSWSRDMEGRYSLNWSNSLGQVIQTAIKPNTAWLYTRYQYFPNGKLKKVLQNSDNPDNDAAQEYREVTNYNSLGEVTSVYTKDRGLRKFWYNRMGMLRFTRHESQPANEYDYTSYDLNDRPFSMGTQAISSFNQAMVEERNTASGTKTEHRGVIYDNLSQFQARTGLLLSDIMPGKTLAVNGEGRVVCEYNPNKAIDLASLAAKDKFVATFFNYNAFGEVTESYKYIGTVKDAAKRIHKVLYSYDNHHRMYQTIMEDNASAPYVTVQRFGYDELGRVNKVTGASGKFYSSYQYYEWGGLRSVILGGSGTSTTGTRIDFKYNAQGWTKEIKATRQATNEVVFQQFLGYENQAVSAATVPALAKAKYDGSIAQQIVKFAKDVESANPIRVVNYKYDDANRMTESDARKNSGTPPWDANQQIIFGSLQLTDTEDMDSRLTFDDKGRMVTNQSGVSSADKATYYYQGESYKLDRVSGKLGTAKPRDASALGSFIYDTRGRMVGDLSKKLTVKYGWDDMPVEFALDDGDSLVSELNFYDAGGSRVSRMVVKTERMVWVPIFMGDITFFVRGFKNTADVSAKPALAITDVSLLSAGDRRWTEIFGSAGEILATSGKSGVYGVSGQIGEQNSDGTYRFFVKNHQGSVMRTVGDNGEYLDAAGSVTDFMAYGAQANLKNGTTEQVQSFTGKELEAAIGLYAFGARWYDPELAIFMSADPVRQFANPYSYGPGDPMNGTDPTGMVWDVFRPSKYGNFFDDAGGLIYRKSGEAKDATGREIGQTYNDIDRWAGGYGEGDEDNILRRMYRSATGRVSSENCAPPGEDPALYRCGEGTRRDGGLGVQVAVSSDGENGSVSATDATGRSLIPLYSWDLAQDRANEKNRSRAASDARKADRIAQEPRPGDDQLACGPCVFIVPALPFIAMYTPTILNNFTVLARYGMGLAPYIPALQGMALRSGPQLGSKLEYFLGRATGNAHNIDRSTQMLRQLERVGLPDNPATRQYLTEHLRGALSNPSNISRVEASGRVVRETLLTGPRGGLKFETIWEGNKLITGNIYGGL